MYSFVLIQDVSTTFNHSTPHPLRLLHHLVLAAGHTVSFFRSPLTQRRPLPQVYFHPCSSFTSPIPPSAFSNHDHSSTADSNRGGASDRSPSVGILPTRRAGSSTVSFPSKLFSLSLLIFTRSPRGEVDPPRVGSLEKGVPFLGHLHDPICFGFRRRFECLHALELLLPFAATIDPTLAPSCDP